MNYNESINLTVQLIGDHPNDPEAPPILFAVNEIFGDIRLSVELTAFAYVSLRKTLRIPALSFPWSKVGRNYFAILNVDTIPESKRLSIFNTLRITIEDSLKKDFGDRNSPVYIIVSLGTPVELQVEPDRSRTAGNDNDLNVVFSPVTPTHRMTDLVLSDKVLDEFNHAVAIVKYSGKIYGEWGFGEIDPNPRAALNFWGPPGTGKTHAAHAVAAELGKKILLLSYAQIESKFVGDGPKLLQMAFTAAAKQDAVLYFDEADSFLGKRVENPQSSSDQAVNSLRSEMLILLEQFKGVAIFSTNLVKNFDRAFESRILAHVKFELPCKAARRSIISKKIPSKCPVNRATLDNLLDELAEMAEGFSGREIKSSVLQALCQAAFGQQDQITDHHFVSAFKRQREMMNQLEQERKGGDYSISSVQGGAINLSAQPELANTVTDLANAALASKDTFPSP